MGLQVKVSGDPRRPGEAKQYERPVTNPDEQPTDIVLVLSLLFGMVALMLKIKLSAWLSLFCCLSAYANMRVGDMDFKQLISSLTFAIFGLVASYVGPLRRLAG